MQKILEGVRVLELGQVLAGPFAGAILADLGAEVIKLERRWRRRCAPHGPGVPPRRRAELPRLQPRQAVGRARPEDATTAWPRFERLAAEADVFIHNLRPGVPEALGIDGPSLCARHPRLIYCAISAFGARRADGACARATSR